jgi:asparagine synthase (glutamine-hydrolysing)
MGAWVKRELKPVVSELLSPTTLARRGLFRSDVVQELVGRHNASRIDGTDRLLALMNLEIWCRVYLDRRTPGDVAEELRWFTAKLPHGMTSVAPETRAKVVARARS